MRKKLIACAIVSAMAQSTFSVAQNQQPVNDDHPEKQSEHLHLEDLTVTASPLQSSALEMTQATEVLAGDDLDKAESNTIGETVSKIPGVQSAYFGPGVGRPIIRGLTGARIDILENNISTNDVSNVSADHAVSVEPFLADQIEVIRGPATLLFGSDTIGGVVNVRTNRIPQYLRQDPSFGIQIEGDNGSDGKSGVARADFGVGSWAFHADAFYRDTNDYDVPDFMDEDGEVLNTLENSAVENEGGALGISYIQDGWRAGIAFSRYDSFYGIPGGHHHEEEHDDEEHEENEHEGEEHGEEEGEETIRIDLQQERVDLEFEIDAPFKGIDKLKTTVAFNDYQHQELEGPELGTFFESETLEGRLEATHAPIAGWEGVIGFQYADRDFLAVGEEAFVPGTTTDTAALFLLEEYRLDDWRFEFGGRIEDQEVDANTGISRDFSPLSLSAGAVWHFAEDLHLTFNVSRSERAPAEEELFANGPHLATQTFEIGDADLTEERSLNTEVSLRKHVGPLTFAVTAYRNDFDDFIYLADTGAEEDELPVRTWVQQDAEFDGLEAEVGYRMGNVDSGHWDFRLFTDTVDAELSDGSNLPRIAPARWGLDIDYAWHDLKLGVSAVRYDDQTDTAPLEESTDGYTLIDANASYTFFNKTGLEWQIFGRARNLNDELAFAHTSFLREQAPLPGRNVTLGIRALFN